MTNLDKKYWESRYDNDESSWDLGAVSPPLKKYIDQLTNKKLKILIPGCGNAYEADYLFKNGFHNVFALDWADNVISEFKKRAPHFPESNIFNEDFFKHDGSYDLIIEQTFFCALPRKDRLKYAKKVHDLLKPNGRLVGLLFNHEFENDSPPYGGSEEEYQRLFNPFFFIKQLSTADNSIKPRAGRELFINFIKI